MKLLILVIFASLLLVDGQSSCDTIGELTFERRSFLFFRYNVIQVCSNISGSLEWTYICYDSNWDLNALDIYCREFGYLRAEVVTSVNTGSYRTTLTYLEGTDKLKSVDCTGEEETLLNCDYNITNSECRLVEYDPSDHCTNESLPTSATSPETTTMNPIVNATATTMNSITNATTQTMNPIVNTTTPTPTINPIVNTTATTMNSITNATTPTMNPIVNITATTMNPITNITATTMNPITNATATTMNPITNATTPTMNPIVNTTVRTMNPITNATTPTMNPITNATTPTMNPIVNTTVRTMNPITNATTPTMNPITNATTPTMNPIVNTTVRTMNPITNATTPTMNPIVNITATTMNPITNATTPTMNPTVNTTATTMNPITNATTPTMNPIVNITATTMNSITNATATNLVDNTVIPETNSPLDISDISSTTPADLIITTQISTTSDSTTQNLSGQTSDNSPLVIILSVIAVLLAVVAITITAIILLVLFCRYRIRRTKSQNESQYYATMSEFSTPYSNYTTQQHTNQIGMSIQDEFHCSNNYATVNEYEKSDIYYTEIETSMLESNYEVCVPTDTTDIYLVPNGPFAVLIEGEVGDYDLYGELPGMDQQAIQKLAQGLATSNFENTETNLYDRFGTLCFIDPPSELPQLESLFGHCMHEISRKDIQLEQEFASGQFGVVYRAVYHTEKGDIPVAIKTLKEAANSDMKVAFMREAAILAQFQHPNVLRMIGVLTTQQPYMMVTELLKTGLGDLLRNMKTGGLHLKENLTGLLVRFSQDISAGMEHLSEKHFIHRDLAARNVLVAKDLSCRIADFGMSRELNSDSEYYTSSGGRIPLRWTAPEAVFYQKYSEKSDVWSFGMTLFEIWSLGDKPWGNDATNEMIVEGLSVGRKLSPPTGCPRDVYSVMVDTWRVDPSSRPTFSAINSKLTEISSPDSSLSTDPSHCLGNDPILSKDLFLELQQIH